MYDKLFINGDWVATSSGKTLAVINPATEAVIADVAAGSPADIERAVSAAKQAFTGWSRTSGAQRGAYLRAIARAIEARAEELAALSSRNNGKPLFEARIDIDDAIATWDYYAGLAEQLDGRQNTDVPLAMPGYRSSRRLEPAGVVGLIVPWNFPFVTTAWKVAPALAAGCTLVLKPSEVTPLVELQLGTIAQSVGLPAGVLNIVCGSGSDVGSALTAHPDIAKISFTGSNRVGEIVMQSLAKQVKGLSLELGGKSPMLVMDDADLDQATDWILGGIFYNAGQGQVERAIELLGLAVHTRPGEIKRWDVRPHWRSLLVDLEAELGSDVYQAAFERGKELDFDKAASELVEELAGS
jgi:betaine-aldehyde dehydrogenase